MPRPRISHKRTTSKAAHVENDRGSLTVARVAIDGEEYSLVEIQKTGDLLLDVQFKNTQDCAKSIPKDALRLLRAEKVPLPSTRLLFRVKLEMLIKSSGYFRVLLSPPFAEGVAIAKKLEYLSLLGQNPADVGADQLPRACIIDEDFTTKTIGRENIFADMLRVVHGSDPQTSPFTTLCWTILVLMADNYDVVSSISRHLQRSLFNHTYRITDDKNGEEVLRQKILILFHLEKGPRFASATKDLIIRGSLCWTGIDNAGVESKSVAWWNLPCGLEAELAHRRICVLRTIASIQNQFLSLYSSRDRQCKLGYDSSSSCDSFQLGEMVKFFTRKGLLSLVSFQSTSPEDANYTWPDAYAGELDALIGILRQCPAYQLDQNHKHCGLRTRLLPALDYIKGCIDTGLGISFLRAKGPKSEPQYDSWQPESSHSLSKRSVLVRAMDKDIDVSGEERIEFNFAKAKPKMAWGGNLSESKELFTAERWNWNTQPEVSPERLGHAFGIMKYLK